MKTYTKKRTLLGLALSRCEGTNEVGKFASSVYKRKSEMND